MKTLQRLAKLILGLMVVAAGNYLCIQANIGLAPWDAFQTGAAMRTGLSYGDVSALLSLVIMVVVALLGEKVGVGTVLNGILIGKFVDLYQWLGLMRPVQNFGAGVLIMLLGQLTLSVGVVLYMSTAWGCGPRDTLMVALGHRFVRMPVGVARGIVEGCVLVAGWALGAKIGVGTVLFVLGMSSVLQMTFGLFHFDSGAVSHEGMRDTLRRIKDAA